jgi:hypothetical protein
MALAGYGALIGHYDLQVPFPDRLSVISTKRRLYETDRWAVFTVKHAPQDTLAGHLTFALKNEGVDLGVLNALFMTIKPSEVESLINNEPTGNIAAGFGFCTNG